MKIDKLIYPIFQESPETALGLLGYDEALSWHYAFQSVEVKEKSYRINGVLLPDLPVVILEIQFWADEFIYEHILSEALIFRTQNRLLPKTEMAVMFASRSLDKGVGMFESLAASGVIRPIYLNEMLSNEMRNLDLMLLYITVKKTTSPPTWRSQKYSKKNLDDPEVSSARRRFFLNLLINVFLEKHEPLTYKELEAMIKMEEIFDFSNNRLVHDIARYTIAPEIAKELAKDMAKDIAHASKLAEIPALRRFGLTNEQIAEALKLSLEDVQGAQ